MKDYYQYNQDVLNGNIVASRAIKLAAKRFNDFLKRDDFYFDEDCVDRIIRIVGRLKHFTGIHSKKPFILLPWQQWIVANIFGFKRKSNDLRVCRKVLLFMSRKSGKSSFAAALGIICALADNEPGAEVDIVANSRQQAKIDFDMISNYLESVDPKSKLCKRYRDNIQIPSQKSKIQVLASDSFTLDGWNSSCFIIDEFHAAKNWDLYNVLISSQGMRKQPLAIVCTTAGFLLNPYPLYTMRQTCIDILEGLKEDETQFSAIYELDEKDDWTKEENWIKAAPSLGQTVGIEYLRDQVQSAKNSPSLETGVKTKNFNIFCQSKDVWISDDILTSAFKEVDFSDFEDDECFLGVDLSAVSDLTATSVLFPPNQYRPKWPDKYVFKNFIYLPESALDDSINSQFYRLWKQQGYLTITSGNVVDYDYILKDQLDIYSKTYMVSLSYDSWNATQWAINATNEGLPLEPFSQSIGNFNRPTKAFELLVKQGKVVIDYSPITRWCFQNVSLKFDFNANCKPAKANNDNNSKIDVVIAMLQALGGYQTKNNHGDGMVLAV